MEWIPFDLSEGEALSLEIDIGNPVDPGSEARIARYDAAGELVGVEVVDDVAAADQGPLVDPPSDDSLGDVRTFAIGDDPIWVSFENIAPVSEVGADRPATEAVDPLSLVDDSVVIAEWTSDSAAIQSAPAYEPAEVLSLADVFGDEDRELSGILQVSGGDSSLGGGHVIGAGGVEHGVVVVFGHEESDALYYIDYII